MINLKNAINEILSKPLFIIIMVLQLAFSTLLIYNVVDRNIYSNFKNTDVYSALNGKHVYNITSDDKIRTLTPDQKNNLGEFEKHLEDSPDFTIIYSAKIIKGIKSFNGDDSFIDSIYKDASGSSRINGYTIVNGIEVSNNFFQDLNINISTGSLSEFTSFNINNSPNYVPVILGPVYSKYFEIGDIIQAEDYNLKIVAFLEKDQYFTSIGSSYYPEFMKSLDTFIIYPRLNYYIENISNYSLVYDNSIDSKYISSQISKSLKEYNLPFSILDPAEHIEAFNEQMNFEINISKLLLYIILAYIYIGTTAVIIASIEKRKKEFGIHIMNGATIKDIVSRVFYELLIINIISLILFTSYLLLGDNKLFVKVLGFNLKSFIISIAISFVFLGILSIFPAIKINKFGVTSMIKGED